MTVGQMQEFIKDLDEDLEILVKFTVPTVGDERWEPLDPLNLKVEPPKTGKK